MSIDYEQDRHVVTITINRPEAHNSLDMDHFRALLEAWTRFRDDESAWVAVVTGTGKAFCTGADLKSFIPELTGTLDRPSGACSPRPGSRRRRATRRRCRSRGTPRS
jgi:enoyl-CoA hydratase/carnithine racemase